MIAVTLSKHPSSTHYFNFDWLKTLLWYLVSCSQSPPSSSASSLRKSLRWLTVRQCVIYKTALITYKTLKTGHLVYLRDLLHYHQPACTLRSSRQLLLYQPMTGISFQYKAFSIMAPAVWNSLVSTCEKFRYHQYFQGTSENWTVLCGIQHGLAYFFCCRCLLYERVDTGHCL